MGQTIVEKILSSKFTEDKEVYAGEYVTARVDLARLHENFARVFKILIEEGLSEKAEDIFWDVEKIVVGLDHYSPPNNEKVAEEQKLVRKLIERFRINNFYDINEGVLHQIVLENCHVLPGMLVVGTDSHTTTYGAYNAASTGIGYTEMAYVLLTGELFFRVPETIKFEITGKPQEFITSKDLILYIAGKYSTEVAQYKSIEFKGDGIKNMTISSRITMSNMSVELGAKFGIFEADDKLLNHLRSITDRKFEPVYPDPDAEYEKEYLVEYGDVVPFVAKPHTIDNSVPVTEVSGIHIDQAVIGSCTNGRLEDLELASKILKGNKVKKGVRLLVVPASKRVYAEAMRRGIINIFTNAGATVLNPCCGPCFGGHVGVLSSGEVCISATNRNFKGRMGSDKAEVYLASPLTVVASAVKGEITDPREFLR
ncbi:3-isopropylmalate dehydratase large subunit [Archaeoglobales archaeon]|nr:MAG: 3-isopropylmalate dehydratase large subunit [Archaeoglobales archaeon]